jgi:glycosyltransferase involved in cell wall biosynthesis
MGKAIHVTHMVLSLDFGGLERIVLDLAREGLRQGQQLSVLCLEEPGTWGSEVEALGVRLICLHKKPGLRLRRLPEVRAALEDLRPDVLHTHQIAPLFYGGGEARQAGVPAILHTEHLNHLGRTRSSVKRARLWLLMRLALRHADRFVGVSEDVAAQVVRARLLPADRVFVVPTGIDLDRFRKPVDGAALRPELGIPQGVPVIGTVGRLSEQKRLDLLLRGFAEVWAAEPGAHLLIVGDGPAIEALRALATELGLNGAVHFAGYQADPAPYLQLIEVFAQTSQIEGMPLAVLEALALSRPVIASRVGGLPMVIENERNGLLYDFGNQAALKAGLLRLLRDREFARRLGEAGRHTVESRFSTAAQYANYQRHYREILNQKAVAGNGV